MGNRAYRWIVGVAVLLLVTVMVVSYRIETEWQGMIAIGAELERVVEEADTRRPVLHGDVIEGFAHDEYARAAALLSSKSQSEWMACNRARLTGDAQFVGLRNAFVVSQAKILAALGRGARSVDVRFRCVWEMGFDQVVPSLIKLREIANVVVLAAGMHIDAGHPDRAVDVLLDGMQMGGDLMRSPLPIVRMMGCAVLGVVSREPLIEQGLIDRLPQDELLRLAEGMRRMDSPLLIDNDSAGEIALAVRSLMNPEFRAETQGSAMGLVSVTWRYCFSMRWMCAENIRMSKRWRDMQLAAQALPWGERKKELDAIRAEMNRSLNPLGLGASIMVDDSLRESLAVFRFVRTAVEYRATGEVVILPDPFGDQLKVAKVGGKLRVESRGRAGRPHPNGKRLEIELLPPELSEQAK